MQTHHGNASNSVSFRERIVSTLVAITATLPSWLLPLGWLALLLRWALGRPATQRFFDKVTVIGIANTTTNTVLVSEPSSTSTGDSALSKIGSWASVVGLVLTLLPILKQWLK